MLQFSVQPHTFVFINRERMRNQNLSKESLIILQDLKDDIDRLFKCSSNIELIWQLEKLQSDNAFQKSADYIRKSLKQKSR